MKLIVQIPCFNEEATLEATLGDIPRQIDGVDEIRILVVDDGSTDGTAEIARRAGVDYIVQHIGNRGLASAFRTGIDASLQLGADIIVNTDADNQYAGQDIPQLVRPILEEEADIVVGDRQVRRVEHFSASKKMLQRAGSSMVRWLSETDIPDAVSGFRAMSREAAMQINILSSFSYTIEMLIQAGRKQLFVSSVPVGVNRTPRKSRLFRSIPQFIQRSAETMLRTYAMYKPLRVFFTIGTILSMIGLAPIVRFLYFYFQGEGSGHVQSLVLGGALLVIGFVTFLIGLLADLVAFNRQLIETALYKVRAIELTLDEEVNSTPKGRRPADSET